MPMSEVPALLRVSIPSAAALLLVAQLTARVGEPHCTATSLEAALKSVVQPDEPGFAVLVRSAGRTVVERGYGVRDLHSQAPIDAATNFRLASCSKQFTAMAVMLLVEDGKLRYDQPLRSTWPDFPDYGKAITIAELLNHTSGLPSYEALMDEVQRSAGARWSPRVQIQDEEVLELLRTATHGKFAPGTRWSYSNSGYVLLGLIVAKVSGLSYPEFLRSRIFGPLHMDGTVAYVKGTNEVARRAYGHQKDGGSFLEADQSATSATLGDGGVYSNLVDLAKWDEALEHHTLLSRERMRPALTPATLLDGSQPYWPDGPEEESLYPGQPVFYGFGWFLDAYRHHGSHPRMWHYGATIGFRSRIERYKGDPLTVIVLANRTDLDPEELAHRLADCFPPLK